MSWCGGKLSHPLAEAVDLVIDACGEEIAQAVAAERERCAKIAEEWVPALPFRIAPEIRHLIVGDFQRVRIKTGEAIASQIRSGKPLQTYEELMNAAQPVPSQTMGDMLAEVNAGINADWDGTVRVSHQFEEDFGIPHATDNVLQPIADGVAKDRAAVDEAFTQDPVFERLK